MTTIHHENDTVAAAMDRDDQLLNSHARVPQNVVYREFVTETVALNLLTGTYHGLNPVAGLMLQAIDQATTLRGALEKLVADNGWDIADVEPDFLGLCEQLVSRGLLELDTHV